MGWLGAAILALHVAGFVVFLGGAAPHGDTLRTGSAFGIGVAITAYTLGLRHALDADHIAAIDNTTRKLMGEGQRPLSVGFFFSLGHSTIVLALGLLIGVGVRGLGGAVTHQGSTLHQVTGLVGSLVSGTFLLVIGLVNLVILVHVARSFLRLRGGGSDEAELERRLGQRGLMTCFYARATRAVRKPWHTYPLGCLFGLGFDTASEVALLVLAGGAGAAGLPLYAIVSLPILFAAGMALFDTLDGMFMTFAYGWAFSTPVRKAFYNLTVTGLSVAVALAIGAIELVAVLADRLGLHGGVWDRLAAIDLNAVGYAVVAAFVLTWAVALAVWHFGSIEERWTARKPATP